MGKSDKGLKAAIADKKIAPPAKANSPTKIKLERFDAKATPPKVNRRQPFPLYIMSAKEGIVMAFLAKHHNVDEQAFTGSLFSTFKTDHVLAEQFDIAAVMIRRAPAVVGYNLPMFATRGGREQFFYNMFVKVHMNIDDNTPANNKIWAENLARGCTDFARTHFEYSVEFEFKADLSDVNTLPPANRYVLNRDVIRLMDMSYPPDHYPREVQAENLVDEYFGDDAATGRTLIMAFDTTG